jgi:hypothetical protein
MGVTACYLWAELREWLISDIALLQKENSGGCIVIWFRSHIVVFNETEDEYVWIC